MDPAAGEVNHEYVDALLVAAGRGDREAFAAFYDQTAPSVFGMVRSVLGPSERAEQAVEDVFLQLWRRAPDYNPAHRSAHATALVAARRALTGPIHDLVTGGPGRHP